MLQGKRPCTPGEKVAKVQVLLFLPEGSLKTHTPQIWEVEIHPPNLGGVGFQKALVLQCFLALTPLGTGFQG